MSTKEEETKPTFTIRRWEALCTWRLGGANMDVCAVCRNNLTEPSVEYKQNPCDANKNGLQLCFGRCDHTFHLDCVQRWLKSNSTCPMCNKEWEGVKYESINAQ